MNILRAEDGGVGPREGSQIEWRLLLLGGHAGIGHLDVFADDQVAMAWYATNRPHQAITNQSELWKMLKQDVMDLGGIIEGMSRKLNLQTDTGEELYRRILMALLTGNGDLHLENTSLIGGVSDCKLSPVYDPAPMRAWPRHGLASAITFAPSGFETRGNFFVHLGFSFGLDSDKINTCVQDALDATESYGERVGAT